MSGLSTQYGGVAQLGERTVRIRKVKGSIPSVSTIKNKGHINGSVLCFFIISNSYKFRFF